MLDTLKQVETPEGVTLHLRPAGVTPRAAAWAIDFVLRFAIYAVASMVLALLGKAGAGLTLIMLFGIYWFYMVLFEGLNHGRTPGKIAMGLRVVNENALPVGWTASLTRNLLRTVDMFPILYGFGMLSMLLDRDARRLGDRVAGTLVVHERTQQRAGLPKVVQAERPPPGLSTDEQVALLSFAERAGYLTAARQAELAGILKPLTGLEGEAAVKRLQAYAGWIAGRR